jgi:signal transduction histidine kinase/DNA-binding NarL/FixJ family response regulator/bacteriorhodopsin
MEKFFMFTASAASTGFVMEMLFALTVRCIGPLKVYKDEMLLRKRLRQNVKMIFTFAIMAIVYWFMVLDVQDVRQGWISKSNGGNQLVYSVRFIEWVFVSPIVISAGGQLDHSPNGAPRNGLIPSSILTGLYCLTSWQALVVTDMVPCVVLISFAFFCYFSCSTEQLCFAWYIKDQGRCGILRALVQVILVILLGIYGVCYTLGALGIMNASAENKFYCVGDAVYKILMSISLMVTNDVASTVEMRKRAELAEQSLFENASVPIFRVNCTGVILQLNKKCLEMLRIDASTMAGTCFFDLIPESDIDKCKIMVEHARTWQDPGTLETTVRAPAKYISEHQEQDPRDRAKIVIVLSAAPKVNLTGEVVGVNLIGSDLTQVSIYQDAEERKCRFLAVMSHELRSPLHGIIGLCESLWEQEPDEFKKKNMSMILNCSKRLLGLVSNIMDMASMTVKLGDTEKKKDMLNVDPTDLAKIAEEVIELVRRSSDKFGKPLVKPAVQLLNAFTPVPLIEADSAKCTQVLYNLITNACKFTKEGSVKVTSKVDPNGRWVEVAIHDTGIGIKKENVTRIFNPFEQEDTSMSRQHEGVGLGLSIAYEVVQGHGGTIKVDSEEGVGTTFTVRLPVVFKFKIPIETNHSEGAPKSSAQSPSRGALPPAPEASRRSVAAPAGSDKSRKKTILSVDDDVVHQSILRRTLSDEYNIVEAMSADEAITYLRRQTLPDVMLLDMILTEEDAAMSQGTTVYSKVMSTVRTEMGLHQLQLPIIMMSLLDSSQNIVDSFKLGINDYVAKPFDPDVLKARIAAALAGKETYEQLGSSKGREGEANKEGLRQRRSGG